MVERQGKNSRRWIILAGRDVLAGKRKREEPACGVIDSPTPIAERPLPAKLSDKLFASPTCGGSRELPTLRVRESRRT